MNVGIQLFTFDRTASALELLKILGCFADPSRLNLRFETHEKQRKSISLEQLLSEPRETIKLNEGYVTFSENPPFEKTPHSSIKEGFAHLSISPSCSTWASPQPQPINASRLVKFAGSVEKAAARRKHDPVPTALQITLITAHAKPKEALDEALALVLKGWSLPKCNGKFGVIDVGPEWLFFPKSGFNPNVTNLNVYFSVGIAMRWAEMRALHNVSISESNAADLPLVLFHSEFLASPSR